VTKPSFDRPMDLAAMFDASFSLYRRYFVTLVGAVGVIVVPVALIQVGLGRFAFLATWVPGLITPAVGVVLAAQVALGQTPTIGSIWRRLLRLIVPLFLTSLIVILTVVAGTVLLIIPGVLFYVWFALSLQAIVIEDRRYFRAMGRSRQLVLGSWWRVFGILLVIAIAAGFASGIVEGAVIAIFGIFGWGGGGSFFAGGAGASHTDLVPFAIATAVSELLVVPVQALVGAFLYFDLRLRKEGTDIAAAVAELERE
jgi:hypothetical protein